MILISYLCKTCSSHTYSAAQAKWCCFCGDSLYKEVGTYLAKPTEQNKLGDTEFLNLIELIRQALSQEETKQAKALLELQSTSMELKSWTFGITP